MTGSAPIGVYVHIPFCASKCPYCDFYSLPPDGELADRYTEALCRAMERQPYGPIQADTLYLGGGTPSLLGVSRLSRLLEAAATHLNLSRDGEVTVEVNPGTVDRALLSGLRAAGCNRISVGVQSLAAGELAALGRVHSPRQATEALLAAHAAGFPHISADVMLGIPRQTGESLEMTLEYLAELPIDHISAYLLKVEPDTPFGAMNAGALCPDEDSTARLYLDCVEALGRLGFPQYEISNFAPPEGQSRHNLKYWLCRPYLGLGPAAHSFMQGRRFYFPRDVHAFAAAEDPFSLAVEDGEGGEGGDFAEYAMLRLRLAEGLNLQEAERRFGIDPLPILRKAEAMEEQGLVRMGDTTISLTPEGFLISNAVTGRLLF